ncbi:MAG: Mur ligase domain-containing protein, partial [Xanthobacteraceae bacterium]
MKLQDLVQNLQSVGASSDPRFAALNLAGISADSRAIKQGDLFVAVSGLKDDGLRFVGQAVASGAAAVMAERAPAQLLPPAVAFIKVNSVR